MPWHLLTINGSVARCDLPLGNGRHRSACASTLLALALSVSAGCSDSATSPSSADESSSDSEPATEDKPTNPSPSAGGPQMGSPVRIPIDAGKGSGSRSATLADGGASGPARANGLDAALFDGDAGAPAQPDAATGSSSGSAVCTPNAFVSNSYSDTVSVIDTNTHKVVATVPTGKAPINPTFTPDRRHVYVANSQADTLTVIDVETNTTTTIPAGGMSPSGLAFSPNGETLYVSFIGENFTSPGSVGSIELSTGKASPPIPMGEDPERIALTPNGERLYVNNLLDGTMNVVDTASRKVIVTLMLGDLPFNPLMSPDGSVVYVGVMSANHIAVVDTATNTISRTIPADSPNGMTFSNDYQSLFVSNALSGTVQQVSLVSNQILKTQDVGGLPGNIAVLPSGKQAYMVRPDGTTVEVLDTSSLQIVQTITAGDGPTVVTICRPPTVQ